MARITRAQLERRIDQLERESHLRQIAAEFGMTPEELRAEVEEMLSLSPAQLQAEIAHILADDALEETEPAAVAPPLPTPVPPPVLTPEVNVSPAVQADNISLNVSEVIDDDDDIDDATVQALQDLITQLSRPGQEPLMKKATLNAMLKSLGDLLQQLAADEAPPPRPQPKAAPTPGWTLTQNLRTGELQVNGQPARFIPANFQRQEDGWWMPWCDPRQR